MHTRSTWTWSVFGMVVVLSAGCRQASSPRRPMVVAAPKPANDVPRPVDRPASISPTSEAKAASADSEDARCTRIGIPVAGARAFFRDLQSALTSQDAETLRASCHVPLQLPSGRVITTRTELRTSFDRIFDARTTAELLRVDSNDLFCTGEGVSWGDGIAWAQFRDGRFGLITLNRSPKPRASDAPQ